MTSQETLNHLVRSIKSYSLNIAAAAEGDTPEDQPHWMPAPDEADPCPQAAEIAKLNQGLQRTLDAYFAARRGATVTFINDGWAIKNESSTDA